MTETNEKPEIQPVAPAGHRLATQDDRTRPCPAGALCSPYPYTHWEATCRAGEILGDSTHAYAFPIEGALADDFNGADDHLMESARALLDLDAEGALVPHGIGGHARGLLTSLCARLAERNATIDVIVARMPATYYADRLIEERVTFMIEGWQSAVKTLKLETDDRDLHEDKLQKALDKAAADLDYFRKNEKAGKRPFSDALSGKVIDGQVKRIIEMEHTILDLSEQLRDRDSLGGAMLGSTVEAQRKRIAELEVPANAFYEIERHLARRSALDGFASAIEKISAMLHLCEQADPSGVLMKQQEPV